MKFVNCRHEFFLRGPCDRDLIRPVLLQPRIDLGELFVILGDRDKGDWQALWPVLSEAIGIIDERLGRGEGENVYVDLRSSPAIEQRKCQLVSKRVIKDRGFGATFAPSPLGRFWLFPWPVPFGTRIGEG